MCKHKISYVKYLFDDILQDDLVCPKCGKHICIKKEYIKTIKKERWVKNISAMLVFLSFYIVRFISIIKDYDFDIRLMRNICFGCFIVIIVADIIFFRCVKYESVDDN